MIFKYTPQKVLHHLHYILCTYLKFCESITLPNVKKMLETIQKPCMGM